ncbi:ketopantoate reductase family protein [Variovorax sp. ZT4R33]|uniref:ketopantoate reductase family protein n=1 Tax=Variovorax sp. ZT4R33 TaxID=3443743 RepID=UPI003F48D4E6
MKIAIVGAGGIGSCLGAALSRVADVTLICRGAHLAAVQQHGLRVIGPQGSTVHDIRATDRPSEVGPVDVIVSCVKLYDLDAVTHLTLPMVSADTFVVPAQNGVTAHEQIGAIVGPERVLGGTVFMSASMVEPGTVKLRSAGASLTFGELNGVSSERVRIFAELCEAGGVRAHVPDNVLAHLWRKFVGLGGAAALSCLSRMSLGEIRTDPLLRKLLRDGMAEVLSLAQAKGVQVDDLFLTDAMAFADSVAADTRISILEDLEAGKPLELEWITGHIVRESDAAGLSAPINEMAYACSRHLVSGRTVAHGPQTVA